jgi:hypothetical protein
LSGYELQPSSSGITLAVSYQKNDEIGYIKNIAITFNINDLVRLFSLIIMEMSMPGLTLMFDFFSAALHH